MVILKFSYDTELFEQAMDLMQTMNQDYDGITQIRERCESLKLAGYQPEVNIYDDFSVEITVAKLPTEKLH